MAQALFEEVVYDENGQLLTGEFMDYAVPKAHQLPRYELDHTVTPSPVNPLGVKGVGEAGTIGSTPAVANAVIDALAPLRRQACRPAAHAQKNCGESDEGHARRRAMIPNNFEYFAPKTIEEALKLIDKYGEDCKILSGGHSLIPVLKLRLAAPAVIVDIGRIEELKTIEVDGGTIRIGGGVTHAEIAADAELKRHCPLLCETASQIGDQQVRNRGTIGGSLTHADPAADWPAAILALDAEDRRAIEFGRARDQSV